jgi:hypothetical protein
MKYQATGYCLDDDPKKSFGVSADIDAKLFEGVERAKNTCLLALGLEEKFQLVIDNYAEWEIELLTTAQRYALWPTNRFDFTQTRIQLARRLTNVLTGFRLYADQTDHALSKIFGNPSDELKRAKEFKNNLYDSYFGYRFLETLRNHVQHCDLPIETISYDQKPISEKSIMHSYCVIIPTASLVTLSENDEFKKGIIEELQSGPETIDLRPYIREYISCMTQLHKEIGRIFSPTFDKSRSDYEKIVKTYSSHGDKNIQLPRFIMMDDTEKKVKTIELYQGFLAIYDSLKERNANVGNVTKSFASNIITIK